MSTRNFRSMLEAKWAEGKFVCVGLDPDTTKIPYQHIRFPEKFDSTALDDCAWIELFLRDIIDSTKHLVCAYKPNSAFFERFGGDGIDLGALEEDGHLLMRVQRVSHRDRDVVVAVGQVHREGAVGGEVEVAVEVGIRAAVAVADRAALPAVALRDAEDGSG